MSRRRKRDWEQLEFEWEVPCIISPYFKNGEGYARKIEYRFGKKQRLHHRIAWIDYHGRLPGEGMVIRHTCDNRACIQPLHLVEGTHKQNNDDMVARGRAWWQRPGPHPEHGRWRRQKTHCPQGHEYNDENTYYDARGYRYCKPCNVEKKLLKRRAAGARQKRYITDAELAEMAEMKRQGQSYAAIGRRFGFTATGVTYALERSKNPRCPGQQFRPPRLLEELS